MASREQLVQALRAADAAGNVEDARRLAAALQNMQPARPSSGVPERGSAGPTPARSAEEVRAEYNELPWYRQAGQAVSDMSRLALDGLTFGASDRYFELMGQGGAAQTQEARHRAGFAGDMANAAGSIATGAGATGAVARSVPGLAGNRLSQVIGREGLAAGSVGAASSAVKTGDLGSMATDGAAAATMGAGGGVAGKMIGGALSAGARRLGVGAGTIADEVVPPRTTEQLRRDKSAAYDQVEQSGITYPRADTVGLANGLRRSIDTRNPSGANLPASSGGLPGARSAMDDLEIMMGMRPAPGSTQAQPNVTPLDIEDFRDLIRGRTAASPSEKDMGRSMIRQIDEFAATAQPTGVPGATPEDVTGLLGNARRANQRYKSSEALDEAAERRMNSSNDQGDVNFFRQILNNPEKRKMYPKEELAVMRRIVRGETAENYLEKIGGTAGLVGLSGTGLMAGSAVAGVPGAIAGGVAGLLARKGASSMARGYTDRNVAALRDLVGGGSTTPSAIRGPLAATGQAMAADATVNAIDEAREDRRRRRRNKE